MSRDVRAAGLFTALTALSRGLGLVRTYVFAFFLGGSVAADAFWAAFRLVNFFRLFLGEGALGNSMVPVLKELEAEDPVRSHRVAADCVWLVGALCLVLVALVLVFTEPLLRLVVGGFDDATRGLALPLTRTMAPYLFLIGVASTVMAPLQALRRFLPVAAHPILFNLSLILFGVLGSAHLGPARAFAWGVVVGGVLQVLLLAGAGLRAGLPLTRPRLPVLTDPALREIGRLTLPALGGVAVMRLNSLVDLWFVSHLPTGSTACLTYGFQLYTAVLGIAGVGVSTVIFTDLSEALAARDRPAYLRSLARGAGMICLVAAPAAALGLVFPESLSAILRGGRYGSEEALRTAAAVRGYFAGMLAGALFNLLSRAHYAARRQVLVVASGAAAAVLNVGLDWLWVGPYGVLGLAGATAAALWSNVAVLAWFLRADLREARLHLPVLRSSALAGLACVPGLTLPILVPIPDLLQLPLYGASYLAILRVGQTEEYRLLREMLERRSHRAREDRTAASEPDR